MDDCPELVLKKYCCTCLSQDRKLSQLCRLAEGVNNLYLLLSHDSEAYKEGFYREIGHWYICWECWAIMNRITRFRKQVCVAQHLLSAIVDGRTDTKHEGSLSKLSIHSKTLYDQTLVSEQDIMDNFIDCGIDIIKSEIDDEIPLSEMCSDNFENTMDDLCSNEDFNPEVCDSKISRETLSMHRKSKDLNTNKYKRKESKKTKLKRSGCKDYYRKVQMNEQEMVKFREKRKNMVAVYTDAKFKCESCIEGFKSKMALEKHKMDCHTKKEDHQKCGICESYLPASELPGHRIAHYYRLECNICFTVAMNEQEIKRHVTLEHKCKTAKRPKTPRTTPFVAKPRLNNAMLDKITPFGYKCPECDKYFDNKNVRWKHVQRVHREGFRCGACDKRFAFKSNLARHQQLHQGPPPREQCPHCRKQVRADLIKVHIKIHTARQKYHCAECDKSFASKASYENHLNYNSKHAVVQPNKYKCNTCDKRYRSRGELRDHINYQHMGKTEHKCPVCDKALATPRCVTRHVRRAHDGVKEQEKDKVCQKCGKAFRYKKTLKEHELIHSGERPLSCEICGRSFRQSASLYTHRRRVHRVTATKHTVLLVEKEP